MGYSPNTHNSWGAARLKTGWETGLFISSWLKCMLQFKNTKMQIIKQKSLISWVKRENLQGTGACLGNPELPWLEEP